MCRGLGWFDRLLTPLVALCMVVGTLIGYYSPVVPYYLNMADVYNVSIPIGVLLFAMIFPMMVQIDFAALRSASAQPRGLIVVSSVNFLFQPFTMLALAVLFFRVVFASQLSAVLQDQYIAGAVILGGSPCTAMVFVWSMLSDGDPAYTLLQVALNDVLMLALFPPTVMLMLQVTTITIPYETIALSVAFFVLLPLAFGVLVRHVVVRRRGLPWLNDTFLPRLKIVSMVGLLLTLVLVFVYQGGQIVAHVLDIALIAVPLTLQTFFVYFVALGLAYAWRIPYRIAAPGSMIAASNFFELAVGVAIALFGSDSGAARATVVGVLTEVPTMLVLVAISRALRPVIERRALPHARLFADESAPAYRRCRRTCCRCCVLWCCGADDVKAAGGDGDSCAATELAVVLQVAEHATLLERCKASKCEACGDGVAVDLALRAVIEGSVASVAIPGGSSASSSRGIDVVFVGRPHSCESLIAHAWACFALERLRAEERSAAACDAVRVHAVGGSLADAAACARAVAALARAGLPVHESPDGTPVMSLAAPHGGDDGCVRLVQRQRLGDLPLDDWMRVLVVDVGEAPIDGSPVRQRAGLARLALRVRCEPGADETDGDADAALDACSRDVAARVGLLVTHLVEACRAEAR